MAATILIIEDNTPNLELMGYLLRAGGYTVLEAPDGEQGLRIALTEPPDLIICDLQMPRLTGYQLATRAKAIEELKGIPIIAVTAFAMVGDREKALAAGFDAYLSKPIEPETFVRDVAKLLPTSLCAQPAACPPTMMAQSPEKKPRTGPTILVVDDVEANLQLKRSLLEPHGYRVMTARGGRAALDLARRVRPELVISDVCMAEGSGYDLLSDMKRDPVLSTIAFIFVSSTFTDERDRRKALAMGATHYFIRPIDPTHILSAVQSCLAEARGR